MAKIAVERGGDPGQGTEALKVRVVAQGDGWAVSDVVCTSGPHSRPFEERHTQPTIALVVAGTFQYRSGRECDLMMPGSVLLGNAGQSFECGHEHGVGDRCLSFSYTAEFFDRLAAEAGSGSQGGRFRALRVPPIRSLSGLGARASAALAGSGEECWEQFAIQLGAKAVQLDCGTSPGGVTAQPGALARVTRIVRMMEAHPEDRHSLGNLAEAARLSPYHFLRTFEGLTGVTPHQYLLRTRLRRAAVQLRSKSGNILDVALDSGFGDISNFNRSFRAEFGTSPRIYRAQNRDSSRKSGISKA